VSFGICAWPIPSESYKDYELLSAFRILTYRPIAGLGGFYIVLDENGIEEPSTDCVVFIKKTRPGPLLLYWEIYTEAGRASLGSTDVSILDIAEVICTWTTPG
jgi:hypothetical protein